MSPFDELYAAAEAAQTAHLRYGQTAEALQNWLTAEVRYHDATGDGFVLAPSLPPQKPYQFEVYRAIAATLCGLRHRHFHALYAHTSKVVPADESGVIQAAS